MVKAEKEGGTPAQHTTHRFNPHLSCQVTLLCEFVLLLDSDLFLVLLCTVQLFVILSECKECYSKEHSYS